MEPSIFGFLKNISLRDNRDGSQHVTEYKDGEHLSVDINNGEVVEGSLHHTDHTTGEFTTEGEVITNWLGQEYREV